MKLTTIALATAFTLTSTFALAQSPGTAGYGSVVAASVGFVPASGGYDQAGLKPLETGHLLDKLAGVRRLKFALYESTPRCLRFGFTIRRPCLHKIPAIIQSTAASVGRQLLMF